MMNHNPSNILNLGMVHKNLSIVALVIVFGSVTVLPTSYAKCQRV